MLLKFEQSPHPDTNQVTGIPCLPFELTRYEHQPSNSAFVNPAVSARDCIGPSEAQLPFVHDPVGCQDLQRPSPLSFLDNTAKSKERSRITPEHQALLRKVLENNAYPSEEEKEELAAKIGIKKKQITNWFANARRPERSVKRKAAPDKVPESESSSRQSRDSSKLERTKKSNYLCGCCNSPKAFCREVNLKRHQKSKHSPKLQLWRCGYCHDEQTEKIYTTRRQDHMIQHMCNLHQMERHQANHPCSSCPARGKFIFRTRLSLDNHMLLEHTHHPAESPVCTTSKSHMLFLR